MNIYVRLQATADQDLYLAIITVGYRRLVLYVYTLRLASTLKQLRDFLQSTAGVWNVRQCATLRTV